MKLFSANIIEQSYRAARAAKKDNSKYILAKSCLHSSSRKQTVNLCLPTTNMKKRHVRVLASLFLDFRFTIYKQVVCAPPLENKLWTVCNSLEASTSDCQKGLPTHGKLEGRIFDGPCHPTFEFCALD